jgi:hypothetical protein
MVRRLLELCSEAPVSCSLWTLVFAKRASKNGLHDSLVGLTVALQTRRILVAAFLISMNIAG